eukprot:CAMPEP_0117427556 /NCGR_PEP_ID=MMETSP0758-20121206/7383_1 /TAXON_ID=63605 /ORGANISM="Percolomonas cosmopolitus, Strain AE-1 (ATCC 50343)" /LENGTH=444 /DNA_ID=CAMNT_0005213269 /DNA_START=12 /DNA_END=1346 /DNA_ORIENTATION=-
MIIRARGKDGMFRITVNEPNKKTIEDIKKEIENNIQIEAKHLKIHNQGETEEYKNQQTIGQLGWKHGEMIYFSYDENYKSKQDKEEEEKKKEMEDILGNGDDITSLGLKYRKKNWTLSEYMELVNKHKKVIKNQKYPVTTKIRVDNRAVQQFQVHLRQMAYTIQRMGYLYGTVSDGKKPASKEKPKNAAEQKKQEKEDEEYKEWQFKNVRVAVVYEPPQHGDDNGCIEMNDDKQNDVNDIAKKLGLERVGWIYSYKGKRDYFLSGREVLKIAEKQDTYGEAFTTLTCGLTDGGQMKVEAFQVSKLCVELVKQGMLIVDPKRPHMLKLKKPMELQRKMVSEVETILFVCPLGIKSTESIFKIGFPVANRPMAEEQPSKAALKRVLRSRHNLPFMDQMTDFQLLIYLSDYLTKEDYVDICGAIKQQNHNRIKRYRELIYLYAGLDL